MSNPNRQAAILLAKAKDPGEVPITNWIRAAQVADADPGRRESILHEAAARLAQAPDAVEQAREIRREFLSVSVKLRVHEPTEQTGDSESMAKRPGDDEPARAATPGERDETPEIKSEPATRTDGNRVELQLVLDGVAVLRAAVLQCVRPQLAQEVHVAAAEVELMAKRYRRYPSVSAQLRHAAESLTEAARAYGTRKPELSPEQAQTEQLVDEAMARTGGTGPEVELVARFAREYDELQSKGFRLSMGRAQYVADNTKRVLEALKQEGEQSNG